METIKTPTEKKPRNIWFLVIKDSGEFVLPVDDINSYGGDAFLAFPTKKDAEAGAKHQWDIYGIDSYPVRIK